MLRVPNKQYSARGTALAGRLARQTGDQLAVLAGQTREIAVVAAVVALQLEELEGLPAK